MGRDVLETTQIASKKSRKCVGGNTLRVCDRLCCGVEVAVEKEK